MMYLNEFEDSSVVEKTVYEDVEKDLQERLYILFSAASKQKFGIMLILEGWAGSGKGDVLKSITTRLDPRKVRVYSRENFLYQGGGYPFLFPFWSKLPAYGEFIIFSGSWYSRVSSDKVEKLITKDEYRTAFNSILNFEEMITSDKYIIYKYFLNISEKEQKKRLKKAKDEGNKWMVSDTDWFQLKHHDEFKKLYEEFLNRTSTPTAPWNIVPAKDKYFTRMYIMESLIANLEEKLKMDSKEMLNVLKSTEKGQAV